MMSSGGQFFLSSNTEQEALADCKHVRIEGTPSSQPRTSSNVDALVISYNSRAALAPV